MPDVRTLLERNAELEAEVRRLDALLEPVVKAWTDPGRVPAFHRQARLSLCSKWPTLARAVIAAAEGVDNPGQGD